MVERTPPILNTAVLCSSLEIDREGIVYALNEPLHTALVEPNELGNYVLDNIALYCEMSDENAVGSFTFTLQLRHRDIVLHGNFPADGTPTVDAVRFLPGRYPNEPYVHVFRIRQLVLPFPGDYHVHIKFSTHASLNEVENAARPTLLRVIAAEPGAVS